ncbi:MAG TPA: hypothetical protein VG711_01060, partial [Phycisphaerales bacterium]|nr:hypothetical protein [Phycisphaerales bacterium]
MKRAETNVSGGMNSRVSDGIAAIAQLAGHAGSLFGQTLAKLEDSLTAAMIASPLEWCRADDEARNVAEWMEARGYSQVVLENPSGGRALIVSHAELKDANAGERVAARGKAIDADAIISHDTGIKRLLTMFTRRNYFLTLRGDRVEGIVGVSDLDKLPTRVMLFVHIMELEARLAEAIVREYPEDAWAAHLPGGRKAKVDELYQRKRERDLQTSRIHCTQFCDKGMLCLKLPRVRERLGDGSARQWDRRFDRIQELRNVIAHGEAMITDEQAVVELAELVQAM